MDLDGIGRQFRRATVGNQGSLVPAVRGEKIPMGFVDPVIIGGNPQGFVKAIGADNHIFRAPLLPGLTQIGNQIGAILCRRTRMRSQREYQRDSHRIL